MTTAAAAAAAAASTSNSKGQLIGRLLSLGQGAPTFEVQESGPPHERTFRVEVKSAGKTLGAGLGRSKKGAERLAAEEALSRLANLHAGTPPKHERATQETPAWPIYSQVLAQAVEAALEFAPEGATLEAVQRDAAQFYRGLLAELGHRPQAHAEQP